MRSKQEPSLPMSKMGRPTKQIDAKQLKNLMRLRPTLADTAAFFETTERTIERIIRKEYDLTFVEFREQNMVHTRLGITRKAVEKALSGDNTMLIWVSKNMLGWSDKIESETKEKIEIKIDKDDVEL